MCELVFQMDPSRKRKLFNKYSQRYKRSKDEEIFASCSTEVGPSTSTSAQDHYSSSSSSDYEYFEANEEARYIRNEQTEDSDSSTDSEVDELRIETVDTSVDTELDAQPPLSGFVVLTEMMQVTPEDSQNLPSFSQQLSSWAGRNNITHKALSELLVIMQKNHISVPKDARTLLKTPRNTGLQIKTISPGFYFHFGLTNCLKNLLELLSKELDVIPNTIQVCVNIDGLPLSKSSTSQLWPIMVSLFLNKNVVDVCGIYHGKEKPKSPNDFLKDFVNDAKHLVINGIIHDEKH